MNDQVKEKKIPLVEMFGPTIQGEGAVIGQQTYFMRFGLCDYKCKMCDSMNAVDPAQVKANATWLTNEEIVDKFLAFHVPGSTRWITLSGGNPCIHDLTGLVRGLKKHGFKFAVETQGTFSPTWLDYVDIITVSPKGPGMGENTVIEQLDKFMVDSTLSLPNINFKIVLFDQRDLEFAKMIFERYHPRYGGIPFYLSLGNPYPPGAIGRYPFKTGDPNELVTFKTDEIDPAYHMTCLVDQYKQIFEDISTDPILSQMRFLPQWHVFVWGNAKGK